MQSCPGYSQQPTAPESDRLLYPVGSDDLFFRINLENKKNCIIYGCVSFGNKLQDGYPDGAP